MPETSKQLLDTYGEYKIYLVDDYLLRGESLEKEEFGGFGSHYDFDFIPEREIWINQKATEIDRQCYIHHALAYARLMKAGTPWEKAYDTSLAIEQKLRRQLSGDTYDETADGSDVSPEIRLHKYGEFFGEDVTVWIVNGEEVRNHYRTEFIEGGHGYIYPWIPKGEIWIEDQVQESERPYILMHEFVEMIYMQYKKADYGSAHGAAAKVEFAQRQKSYSKAEVFQLTKEVALEFLTKMDLKLHPKAPN